MRKNTYTQTKAGTYKHGYKFIFTYSFARSLSIGFCLRQKNLLLQNYSCDNCLHNTGNLIDIHTNLKFFYSERSFMF